MGEYNGWSNYETWLLALWIDNERSSYVYWQEVAAELNDTHLIADRLRDDFAAAAEDRLGESGFWLDLVNAALSEVDWCEVAEHISGG